MKLFTPRNIFLLISIIIIYVLTISDCKKDGTFNIGRYNTVQVNCSYMYYYLFFWAFIVFVYLYYDK